MSTKTGPKTQWHRPTSWPAEAFLIVHCVITLPVLIWLLYYYTHVPIPPIPDGAGRLSFSFESVVPLWVPWAGALGGTTVSLVGVAHHGHDWNGPQYALWHLLRPILGMITGTLAVLILLFVIRGVTGDANLPDTGKPYDDPGLAVLVVIAFIVGFREETFIELMKRVLDVVLGPGTQAATQGVAFVPSALKLKVPADDASASVEVTIHNATSDTFNVTSADLSTDNTNFTVTLSDGLLGPNGSVTVTVTYEPDRKPSSELATLRGKVGGYTIRATVSGSSTT